MKSRLVVTPNLCTGCRTCELACAFAHSVDGKPGRSRIYPLPAGSPDAYTPVVCFQCDDPACVKSCLVDAITMNEETGAVDLDQEKCVKCGACTAACPFGCALHDTVHSAPRKRSNTDRLSRRNRSEQGRGAPRMGRMSSAIIPTMNGGSCRNHDKQEQAEV
jgi:Fe-S-cluster-containing hydrogenase component 2